MKRNTKMEIRLGGELTGKITFYYRSQDNHYKAWVPVKPLSAGIGVRDLWNGSLSYVGLLATGPIESPDSDVFILLHLRPTATTPKSTYVIYNGQYFYHAIKKRLRDTFFTFEILDFVDSKLEEKCRELVTYMEK